MSIQLRTFQARIEEPGHTATTKTIEASYFTMEDRLVEFKDSDHKTVYAVRWDLLLSVERVQLTADAQSDK